MKCYKCGCESPEDFAFCPKCGERPGGEFHGNDIFAQSAQGAQTGAAAQRVLTSLKDSLFLVLCILFTVGTAISVLKFDISVINILLTIFLWLAYVKAQKGDAGKEHLRCVSGTVFASYVLAYVACGAAALGGLILIVFGGSIKSAITEVMGSLDVDLYGVLGYEWFSDLGSVIFSLLGFVLIIIAVVGALFNYFGTRNIHRFVQSVYMGLDDESVHPVKVNAAGSWILVFGIFSGISAVSSLFGSEFVDFISSGATCAAEIIGYMMIKKYYN